MSAPDTSTTAGKIAVMGAWLGRKTVQLLDPLTKTWRDLEPTVEPQWDWSGTDYRIAPEPTVVPFTVDTCPLGATVRNKRTGFRYIITAATADCVLVADSKMGYDFLLEHFEKLDPRSGNWFPAGTVEGGEK